jgi:hypothetical protein
VEKFMFCPLSQILNATGGYRSTSTGPVQTLNLQILLYFSQAFAWKSRMQLDKIMWLYLCTVEIKLYNVIPTFKVNPP